MVGTPETRERLQQHRQILLAGEATRVDEQACFFRQPELPAQIQCAAFRMKDVGVHTEWLVPGVHDSDAVEKLAHQPARREYNVEAFIQPAQVATQDALRERAAEAARENLWQMGVIERDYGNTPSARDVQRSPRRLEGVAGLDEARLQGAQQTDPAARIQREPVVEGAGNRKPDSVDTSPRSK